MLKVEEVTYCLQPNPRQPLGVHINPPPLSYPFCSHWTNLPWTLLEMLEMTSANCLTHTRIKI